MRVESDFENAENAEHPVIEVDKKAAGLFLFDIDGTLVDAKKIHGAAVLKLYKEKFNLAGLDDEEFQKKFTEYWFSNFGKGDREEHELLMTYSGITFSSDGEKQATLDWLVTAYGKKFEAILETAPKEEKEKLLLPGVQAFLDEMSKRHIPAAIVTGNVRRTAEAIVKHLNLARHFVTGGYDDDPGVTSEGMRRANIFKSTLEKCRAKGLEMPIERIAVFGDTPKDYNATLFNPEGRPYVFLLATGDHRFHDLVEVRDTETGRKPHLVLARLSDIKLEEFFNSLEKTK